MELVEVFKALSNETRLLINSLDNNSVIFLMFSSSLL
jgi:hypothetical protein